MARTGVRAVRDLMPILVIGSSFFDQVLILGRIRGKKKVFAYWRQILLSQAGFTLLEIMLVLLIMAVVSALVLPNVFSPPSARMADEGRHLRQVLHLAAEEAQLRNIPLRWSAYANRYVFEIPNTKGVWRPMHEKPFAPHTLPEGVYIESVQLQDALPQAESAATDNHPPLGRVTLFPDGMLTLADVTLASASGQLRIQLRPGPNGIHVVASAP